MNDQDDDIALATLYVCVKDLVAIAFFCYLAVLFNHWWIVLFSIIFQSVPKVFSFQKSKTNTLHSELVDAIVCDRCGEVLLVENMEDVVTKELPQHGWRRVKIDEKWITLCKRCVEKCLKKR